MTSTQMDQWNAMSQRVAQLQAAEEHQAAETRARDIELEKCRLQQIDYQKFQVAQQARIQQEAAMLAQHRITADLAAAEQLRAQQDQSVDFQQRIESEKHKVALEEQQLEQDKQRIAAREKSLMDRELQFQTRSGEYLADAKRTIEMHGAENKQFASCAQSPTSSVEGEGSCFPGQDRR